MECGFEVFGSGQVLLATIFALLRHGAFLREAGAASFDAFAKAARAKSDRLGGVSEGLRGRLGAVLGSLGESWERLGVSWERLTDVLEPSWSPKVS